MRRGSRAVLALVIAALALAGAFGTGTCQLAERPASGASAVELRPVPVNADHVKVLDALSEAWKDVDVSLGKEQHDHGPSDPARRSGPADGRSPGR